MTARICVSSPGAGPRRKGTCARPQATVLVIDPQNPYRYLEIRGTVEEVTPEGAEELANQLTQRYVNQPTFFGHVEPNEKRQEMQLLACRIKPIRVVTYG